MKFAAIFLLFAAASFAQNIGTQQEVGNVSMLSVETPDEMTVFVRVKTCDSVGVVVSVVLANVAPGEKRILTQSTTWNGCGYVRPVKFAFVTDGHAVSEIRVSELQRMSTQAARPVPAT